MKTRILHIILVLGLLLSVASAPAISVEATPSPPSKPMADKVIFFSADGMRPDLMALYAFTGAMPTYRNLWLRVRDELPKKGRAATTPSVVGRPDAPGGVR